MPGCATPTARSIRAHKLAAAVLLAATPFCAAQRAPATAVHPWTGNVPARPATAPEYTIDPSHLYSLPELIDLAEQHNPETRAAWQRARVAAANLGISRSAFLPALSAFAAGEHTQQGIVLNDGFHIEDLGLFEDGLQLNYTIFDFGARQSQVDISRARLLAANFAFNNTHRRILFGVTRAYYRLVEFEGREAAAEIAVGNARTVQQSAEARLDAGLGTLPDVLEARSAAAQADLQLQQEVGNAEIARGDLASVLELPPSTPLRVQPIDPHQLPAELSASVEDLTQRAIRLRPDLMQSFEQERSAEAGVRGARSAYFPTLSFSGNKAHLRAWGALDYNSVGYATGPVWDARLSLNWSLFDGFRREEELSRSLSERRAAQAELQASQDQVENEVWAAFSTAKTAIRRRSAAVELLRSASESYQAALDAYNSGVRTLIDVVTAQRTLAQAQAEDVSSQTGVLLSLADLSFRTGEILQVPPTNPGQQPTGRQP